MKMAPDHPYYPTSAITALGYLAEEAGEVLAAVGKIMRWGWDSPNPELPKEKQETNSKWLRRELKDLRQAIDILEKKMDESGHV